MNIIQTGIEGLIVIEPKVFGDARGYFFESYNQNEFAKVGISTVFRQDNQSFSRYGVIRGLHFQLQPYTQTKLIRAVEGVIYDVAVDLRKGSPAFGKWFGIELSAENKKQLYIPQGFAHGFSVLSEQVVIQYKCDNFYHPQAEGGLRYDDPQLGIDWKVNTAQAIISDKDKILPALNELETNFEFL
ncbi:MAG: dTDP-4-dehydrorhamnose 3,5-epimerase [Bacteroidales bacterium]|jgi:dTDP-4-dehydrorhamnose 3,5-epimerase|nr:dTDP-4-dehydrorhamnose 3,5-epimerase [Bacteroidales bacterium]